MIMTTSVTLSHTIQGPRNWKGAEVTRLEASGTAALGELSVECFSAGPDFTRDGLPLASCRETSVLPSDPGIKPFAHSPQRKNFRAQAGRLNLVREVSGPGFREIRIFSQTLTHRGLWYGERARRHDRNGVAMVAVRKQGRFREDRPRSSPLQDKRGAADLVANEMRFAVDNEVQHGDLVTLMEQMCASVKLTFGRVQVAKLVEQRHEHDIYHVSIAHARIESDPFTRNRSCQIKRIILLSLFLWFFSVAGTQGGDTPPSPYAGHESRAIKSLSQDDIAELRRGGGWGLAKVAELNGMPGPAHLLELKNEIPLSADQVPAITAIFGRMRADAIAEGERLITRERALEEAFRAHTVTNENLRVMLAISRKADRRSASSTSPPT